MRFNIIQKSFALFLLLASSLLVFSCQNQGASSGELGQAYEKLFKAVKSKDAEQIKQVMSKNSLGLAEFAASQQKKSIEQVLENGFTATTFSETLPKMRDERIKDEFGAIEVWNEKDKRWEDLPFIKEDGVWKFAMGDMFKGTYQKPGLGQAVREQEEANKNNPNLVPQSPPMNPPANSMANANANVNTVQVMPIKPALEKRKAK
ncbi:MAG TPA: hypothetical protein VGC76_08090 [Pyrinomonadaceae bacterium]|jgi:hypothetical protein